MDLFDKTKIPYYTMRMEKTALITGASRGIGLAIAKQLSQQGYHTAILAKTTEPHPKLPGTIYTAAKEISDAGKPCLPIVADLRHEEDIYKAYETIEKEFGHLDILINNAGAVKLTDSLNLPLKHYDLMHRINGRGCFICCQIGHKLLKKSNNPHIINISPPLTLDPQYLLPHLAYTSSKYAMSLYTLGLAQQFKQDHIAVNSLWPRMIVDTAALNYIGPVLKKKSRSTQIMADAVAWMVQQDSQTYTGQLLTDEQALQQSGVDNFDHYAIDPDQDLFKDLFVD